MRVFPVFAFVCLFFAAEVTVWAQPGGDRRLSVGGQRADSVSRPTWRSGDSSRSPSAGGGRPSFGSSGGRSFGGGGDPRTAMAARLDTNKDGRIDQREIDAIDPRFKGFMDSRGIRLQPGTIQSFSDNMRSQFERLRSQESARWAAQRQEGGDQNQSTANRSEYKPSAPFRQRKKERMTIDLPEKYTELDTDLDGQVGMHEWIVARRSDIDTFDEIDLDGDGLLIPRELKMFDEVKTTEERQKALLAKYERPRVVIVTGSGSTTIGAGGNGKSILSDEARQKQTDWATKQAFPYLDADKNGKVSVEEMNRSRRVKPMFERAGIKITEMDAAEFGRNYIKAYEFAAAEKAKAAPQSGQPQSGGRGGFGGSGGRGGFGSSGGREGSSRGGFGGGRGR